MRRVPILIFTAFLALSLSAPGLGAQKEFQSGVKSLSRKQLIELSMSAAPSRISKNAAIMIQGPDGKFETIRKGTNGFTCVPDIDGQAVPSPMCADEAAMRFYMDMWSGKESPTNDTAGVGYMSRGGWHWEKNGKVIMSKSEPGAKRIKEPPHWMLMCPFDSKKTMLPAAPTIFGSWVMFDGTPYAHLMVYQDPRNLSPEEYGETDTGE